VVKLAGEAWYGVTLIALREGSEGGIGVNAMAGKAPVGQRWLPYVGGVIGVSVAALVGYVLYQRFDDLDDRWGPYEMVLGGTMPFVLLGLAQWHFKGSHNVSKTTRSIFDRFRPLRWLMRHAAVLVLTIVSVIAAFIEGFEFTILTLGSNSGEYTVGIAVALFILVVGSVVLAFIGKDHVWLVMKVVNWLLVGTGALMLWNAHKPFEEQGHVGVWRLLIALYIVLTAIVISRYIKRGRASRSSDNGEPELTTASV
jgi:hypothetical protein